MASLDPSTPWHDERWRVKGDNPLQAGLRLQQAWWRQECLAIPEAGHLHPEQRGTQPGAQAGGRRRNPLVVSMLPESVEGFDRNLMFDEAVAAYDVAQERPDGAPGVIHQDRVRRHLLCSQAVNFNLFGYLAQSEPGALLAWVQTYAPEATRVADIRLEHAPSRAELGEEPLSAAAFDAFVAYDLPGGRRGFVAVRVLYDDDLAKGLSLPAEGSAGRAKYVAATEAGGWRDGAAEELLQHRRNLQVWYDVLLAQRAQALVRAPDGEPRYAEHTVVVVICRQNTSAGSVVTKVAALLADDERATLRSCTLDDLIDAVSGHEPWKHSMRQRYTDFTPIQRELAEGSPLRMV